MYPRSRTRLAAALVAAAALVPAAPAAADSIVYIDGGNVWSASPDGVRKVQLTDGGDWHSPTQSDDGTIAAVEGVGPITLMARDGRPLHTITTLPARSGDGGTFAARPVQLSLSPDGSRLAYAYVANSCPVASTCGTVQRSTFYTATNVTEATPQSLFGEQFSVSDPEWITNDRTLLTGGYGSALDVDDLAGGGDSSFTRWVKNPSKDVADAELSRDGRRLVFVADYGANAHLEFATVDGNAATDNPPPAPVSACTSGNDAAIGDPSWSPDGTAVALRDTDGVEVLRFRAFGVQQCETTGPSALLAAGASEPDWGPADPPAGRYAGPAPTPNTNPPAHDGGQTPNAAPGATGAPVIARTALAGRALARGTGRLVVVVPAAGTVGVKVSAGGLLVASGSARATRAGAVSVRLGRAAARALAAARRAHAVRVTATFTRPGAVPARTSATARVR